MAGFGLNFGRSKLAAIGAAALIGMTPAQAQDSSVSDFRLTPGASPTTSPSTSAQGPVDPESPAATTPSAPAPAASPAPRSTPSTTPTARPSPRASATPSPGATPRTAQSSVPSASASPASQSPDTPISSDDAEPAVADTPLAEPAGEAPADDPVAAPTPESTEAAPVPADGQGGLPGWLWLVIAAVPLLGAMAWLGRKPRRADAAPAPAQQDDGDADIQQIDDAPVDVAPVDVAPVAAPQPEPAPVPLPPPPPPAPMPEPVADLDPAEPRPVLPSEPMVSPLAIRLEATRISQTLVNALVDYTVTISNMGSEPLARIVIGGDLTGAHKSRDQNELLGMDGQPVDALHNLDALEPGAEAVFKGQLKLPLIATHPIQHQGQTLFVPIARFRCMFARPNDDVLVTTHAYVVGTTGQAASGKLGPFRLDLGPRSQDDVSQRAIIVAPQPA